MKQKELYRLPSFGRMEFRAVLLRALGYYLLALAFLAWILAQYVAHRLAYPEALGEPWVRMPGVDGRVFLLLGLLVAMATVVFLAFERLRALAIPNVFVVLMLGAVGYGPLYTPAHFFIWVWWLWHVPEAKALISPPLIVFAGAAGAGGLILVVHLSTQSARFREQPHTHGSAHWADEGEVNEAGLLGSHRGLLLGLWQGRGKLRYLRHEGSEHVFVFAPTRTGKGVGLVLPNLLSWPHSVLVHDIKGENWALSAGWRRERLGSACLRFDPTDTEGTCARYNPLLEIRRGPHEVRDAQNVADILVDPNGDRIRDHWDRTAHALLVGVILHVLYAEPDKTLRGCVNLLTDPAQPVHKTLESMITTVHDPHGKMQWVDPGTAQPTTTHPVVASAARALLDKAPNERSGVLSTALSFLELYRDPIIATNTETSDFTISDLMRHERPVSLYLTVPSSDLSRTRPLVRMLLNQALRRLTETLAFADGRQVPHYSQPLLLMLDEFPALGRLRFFQESLAYLAGYGIRAFLVTQDLSQHYGVYGKEESITGNCHIRVAFTANKPETAELISRMAGDMTVHGEQRSYRGDRFDLVLNKQYVAQHQTRRRLLMPDEAMRLPSDDALIFVAGHAPIRAAKIRYFDDERLSRRAKIPPPGVSDVMALEPQAWTSSSRGRRRGPEGDAL
ncbi:MAG: type IV secretory system conjugative DNA transfer family protein [bacterium]|nr:type IV secretory system conjugative DNA transfer family protein [bacterium]